MIRRYAAVAFLTVAMWSSCAAAQVTEAQKLFYEANSYYAKGDYAKAAEAYLKILETKLESGNIYYNIGNSFFKLHKLGYAILCYEKARRLMPGDSDLKSNLEYARSLVERMPYEPRLRDIALRAVGRSFAWLNLNDFAVFTAVFYLFAAALTALFVWNRLLARKFLVLYIAFMAVFLFTLASFTLRYIYERVVKHGVVLQKEVACAYEPIDKSATHYTLREGDKVVIMKTREGWRQIKRRDGKAGWVKKEAVEAI
ncbi:MAG: hypothetical protein JW919_01415 [Candidatus Omnitrophica bacterium]|nr:hypothetical protein [Candidatus Omnitrophota bacterium]